MVELIVKSANGNKVLVGKGEYVFGLVGINDKKSSVVLEGNIDPALFMTYLIQAIDSVCLRLADGDEEEAQIYKKTFIIGFTHYQLKKLKKETPED